MNGVNIEGMARAAYHHGNLGPAAVELALSQVARGGMAALNGREVARTLGVAPAALYRHFADVEHLKAAVSQQARQRLAIAMASARDAAPRRRDPRRRAVERFVATGTAYVVFAQTEPGLFDAAFTACGAPPPGPDDPSAMGVLAAALDDLVTSGAMPPARRDEAPLIAWSSVHGLAALLAFGEVPPDLDREAATATVVAGVLRALELTR